MVGQPVDVPRYSIEVRPPLKGKTQERYRVNQLDQLTLADKCLEAKRAMRSPLDAIVARWAASWQAGRETELW